MPKVKFPGDPEIKETGSGGTPVMPLDTAVRPTHVELLDRDKSEQEAPNFKRRPITSKDSDDDYEEDDFQEEAKPTYERERIAARIGTAMEETNKIAEVEAQLDSDDVVPMIFPKPVHLQDKGIMHHWGPGVHLVPVSIAGDTPKETHSWLKFNKVRRAGKRMPRPEED